MWLTQATGHIAWALRETDYLNSPLGKNLEAVGRIVENPQKTESIITGRELPDSNSPFGIAIIGLIHLSTPVGAYATTPLPPANNAQNASGGGLNLNNDGSCIVGYQDSGFFTQFHAFRGTQATGAVDIGTLDPPNNASRSSFATDTNQDCSVVVGFSDVTANGAIQHAFRWTSAGMVDLGAPTNGGPNSRAFGVSSNGTAVVGDAEFPDANNLISGTSRKAFRWTQAGGFQNLGDLQPAGLSIATAVTADGTVVVGQASTNTGTSAFRWTIPPPPAQPVMQPIGPLPGHTQAVATGVSDNGKIVVGTSASVPLTRNNLGFNKGNGAFRWTHAKGLQDLRQILIDGGVDMTGVTLVSVTGMSRDGQYILGAATTPQTGPNETVAYLAHVCDADIGGPCTTTGAAPFTLGASPNQLTVAAGNSGTTTITVTPNAGFSQPINFSCGGLPVGASCSFSPASVTPSGGPVNTTFTISTNGGAVASISTGSSSTLFASILAPIALVPVGLLMGRQKVGHLTSLVTGCLIALALVGLLSCNGNDSTPPATNSGGGASAGGTPAGTSNVTVTATSASGSTGVPLTLTVTRP